MDTISFSEAFKYPFKRPMRLLYILLIFIPLIGWFALYGLFVRIVNEFVEGKYEGLPALHFMDDLVLGFKMFLKSLPFFLVYFIVVLPVIFYDETAGNILSLILGFFVLPVLSVNFFRKQTVGSYFEFGMLGYVAGNIGDYVVAMLKQYALIFVFLILSIVLVGIPAMQFTTWIFIANFYGRYVREETGSIRENL